MAKSISEEELQLRKRARRRLIGAIALVTVVAVFLPMVLDHEPKPVSQDISIQIPAPDAGTFISKIVPVIPGAPDAKPSAKPAPETPAKVEPAKAETPKAVAAAKPAEPTPSPNDTEASPPKTPAAGARTPQPPSPVKPAPKPAPKPAAAAKSAATSATADGKSGFVVQVVALSDADKAKQMQEQILAAGIKSYTEVVPTAKGSVTRVRVGPFASRDEAEKAREKLKALGLSGNVVPK